MSPLARDVARLTAAAAACCAAGACVALAFLSRPVQRDPHPFDSHLYGPRSAP